MEDLNEKRNHIQHEKMRAQLQAQNVLIVFEKLIPYLFLPGMVFVSFLLTRSYLPGLWSELFAVAGIAAISLLIRNNSSQSDDNPVKITWNLSVVTVAAIMLMKITDDYNANQANLGPALTVISILLVLFGLYLRNSAARSVPNESEQYYCDILNSPLAIFVTVYLLGNLYTNFGTQFIWLPAISLWALWFCFGYDTAVERNVGNHSEVKLGTEIILGLICSISTVSQFWFSKIIFGFNLSQCLLVLIIIASVIGLFMLRKRYLANKQEEALEKENSAEQQKLRDRQFIERQQLAIDAEQRIAEGKSLSWTDVLIVANFYDYKIDKFRNIAPKIADMSFNELVLISDRKEEINYTDNFCTALKVLETIAKDSHNDTLLDILSKQLDDLDKRLLAVKKYEGYNSTMDKVRSCYPTIYKLLSTKNVA